jgi:hypothetical protein
MMSEQIATHKGISGGRNEIIIGGGFPDLVPIS